MADLHSTIAPDGANFPDSMLMRSGDRADFVTHLLLGSQLDSGFLARATLNS